MSAQERKHKFLASTPGEDLGPGSIGEESQEAPSDSHENWTFLGPHEWVPEVPILTQEEHQVSRHNSRKTRRFSPQCEMRPFSAVAS